MLRTPVADDDPILLTIEDDDEEAPWMRVPPGRGDWQGWAASNLYMALRIYARRSNLLWYVAFMVPILYSRPGSPYMGKFSPDVYVAFVEDRPRSSFDLEEEGGFPPFVLEVLSPESTARDTDEKVRAYNQLGAREYLLFAPTEDLGQPPLQGYQKDIASGQFVRWSPDESGRMYSEVLGLWLEAEGPLLRARTRDGTVLPTYEELDESYEREAEARRGLEQEVARLREELERRRGE